MIEMNHNDQKYIVKKLMQVTLADKELAALNDREPVKKCMFEQWNNAPDAAGSDKTDGGRIWYHIRQELQKVPDGRHLYYKLYSIAVSLLLLLAVGMGFYFGKNESVSVYVVTSGIQNMQSVSLPDGTVVQLGPRSKLTYPSVFTGETREIQLDGQAFFDVCKNPGKPFIVHTSNMDIQALGTAFEVFDYTTENKSETILLNGKVKIGLNNRAGETKEFTLLPNEMIVHDKRIDTTYISDVDADKYTFWRKQKILGFENEKLAMIIPRLEQWYGRKIMYQQDLAEEYRFTFKVKDESLERILFIMRESSPLKYQKIDNGDFIIKLK